MIEIWTDGSGDNRPEVKNGGYGYVLIYGENEKHVSSDQYSHTTSARMEIRAVLAALTEIKSNDIPIKLYCDNQYVCHSISKGWADKWEREEWKAATETGLRINYDLWKQVLIQVRRFTVKPELIWIKGHNGTHYNELADRLADKGRKSEIILKDL